MLLLPSRSVIANTSLPRFVHAVRLYDLITSRDGLGEPPMSKFWSSSDSTATFALNCIWTLNASRSVVLRRLRMSVKTKSGSGTDTSS